jgi:hypothetical protein
MVPETGLLLLIALSVTWAWQPITTVIARSLKSGELLRRFEREGVAA